MQKYISRAMVKQSLIHHNTSKKSCLLVLSTLVSSGSNSIHAFAPPVSRNVFSSSFTTRNRFKRHSSVSLMHQAVQISDNPTLHRLKSTHLKSSQYNGSQQGIRFRKGDLIQVEVVRFGPLGASVEIISHNSHSEEDLIPEDEEPLGYGLILQSEIAYFRASRGGTDVVRGEILPAYVDWERNDGKVDITLRRPGGKGKAEDLGQIIMKKLKESDNDEIPIGDKSSPEDINKFLPGSSKASFKRAVASLYKQRLVQPGAFTTKLM